MAYEIIVPIPEKAAMKIAPETAARAMRIVVNFLFAYI
jgi:hypothetical protein